MRSPPRGARYRAGDAGFEYVFEYVGPNLAPEYEQQDACLIRCVSAPPLPGYYLPGDHLAVEPRWFETHERVR